MTGRKLSVLMEHLCDVPYRYGPVRAMCSYQDSCFVATESGTILRLVIGDDGLAELIEVRL